MISLNVKLSSSTWSQMNSDCGSTNYVNFTGKQFKPGWNFTSGTYTYRTLAVSNSGKLFMVAEVGLKAGITAISAQGKVLWTSKPLGDVLSNIIHDTASTTIVVVGISDDYNNSTLYNINSQNGKIRWKKMYPEIATSTLLSWSNATNAVYLGDYDYRNFIAVSVKDGSVMWNKTGLAPLYEDQPTGVSCDGKAVYLPTDVNGGGPSNGTGTIIAYAADSGKKLWNTATNFSIDGHFASGNGILFGGIGNLGPGGDGMFALNATNGSLLWAKDSLCTCKNFSQQTSGPAVDGSGNAYFSCGNQMYSVDSKGNKRWISAMFGKDKLNTCMGLPPSIDPKGYVYFIHSNNSAMYSLSTADGSVVSAYHVGSNTTEYSHPPILLGEKLIYLVTGPAYSAVSVVKVNK
jgi:outer membrane protein assembly factor BamB